MKFFQKLQDRLARLYDDELTSQHGRSTEHPFRATVGTSTTEKRLQIIERNGGALHCLEDEMQLHKTLNKYNSGVGITFFILKS